MEIHEMVPLLLTLIAGGLLGAMFFGGLWWTIHRGVTSRHPGLWFLTSMVLRMGVTLSGFFFVADGHWDRFLSCLAGFLMARLVLTRMLRAPASGPPASPAEASHAP